MLGGGSARPGSYGTRTPQPSPIARAIEVPASYRLVFHSGLTPQPADPKAPQGTPEYWGNTKTQSLSVLSRLQESLKSMGARILATS